MNKNYFVMFNLKKKFNINKKKLTKNFYSLQKKFHPDMNVLKSNKIKNKFLKKSIQINQGYKILKNSFKRAKYFLKINNIKISKKCFFEQSFLMKQIKLHKKFNVLRKLKNKKKIKKLIKKIKILINNYKKKLTYHIFKKNWKSCKLKIFKISFLKKFKKNVEKFIFNLSFKEN
ncbi:Fe-S protein assembly co-chaperone HscB [Buchnera aphidicola]|uniref:Fe-S protein assembly co-chaperone HscB n=1 Tax=Buchnera aphidicola TaxID=9 RepID=UPI003463F13B